MVNLTATNGTLVNNGSSYTFTPNTNYYGQVNLSYQVIDGKGGSVNATNSLWVYNVNDPPTLTGTPIPIPNGVEDQQFSISRQILISGYTDADGDTLIINNLSASNAQLDLVKTVNSGIFDQDNFQFNSYVWTPNANYNGIITLNYNLKDGNGGVTPVSRSFNLAPVADSPSLTGTKATLVNGTEDTPYTINVSSLLQGYSDPENFILYVTNLSATNGSLTNNNNGTYTFTPNKNYFGTVNLSYNVIDGQGGNVSASNKFTIDNGNDAPFLNGSITLENILNYAGLTVKKNTPFTFSLSDLVAGFKDPDGDTLSVSNLSGTNGSWVRNNNDSYTFTPNNNYVGSVSLSYNVIDGKGGSIAASNQFTVTETDILVTRNTDNGIGDTEGSLSWAIKKANDTPGLDVIKLTTNIRLAFGSSVYRMTTLINSDMIIDGYNYTINGDNNNDGFVDESGYDRPIFFVYGGETNHTDKGSNGILDVTFKNLTLKGGVARGGWGGSAGMDLPSQDSGFGVRGSNGDNGRDQPDIRNQNEIDYISFYLYPTPGGNGGKLRRTCIVYN